MVREPRRYLFQFSQGVLAYMTGVNAEKFKNISDLSRTCSRRGCHITKP
jgi:hypothetical protein